MDRKEQVGREAALRVEDGQVIGLGTGSTTHYFIKSLGERIKKEEMEIYGVPTSYQSFYLAKDCDINLTTLDEHHIDLAVDGADEVDPQLNLIKGGGAAHTREKIVDSDAKIFIVIVDDSKMVQVLGKTPLPVEVMPMAMRQAQETLIEMGGNPQIRSAEGKDGPVVTDNGNFILDVDFNEIKHPELLEKEINNIPGVLDNGLFVDLVDEVIIGESDGIRTQKKP